MKTTVIIKGLLFKTVAKNKGRSLTATEIAARQSKIEQEKSSSDQNRNNASQSTSRAGAELTKKNVVIIGDSQLGNIDGAKLSNEHFNVTVKPMPGARIARMKNVNYADADVVIVHAGMCNLKKQSNPEVVGDTSRQCSK